MINKLFMKSFYSNGTMESYSTVGLIYETDKKTKRTVELLVQPFDDLSEDYISIVDLGNGLHLKVSEDQYFRDVIQELLDYREELSIVARNRIQSPGNTFYSLCKFYSSVTDCNHTLEITGTRMEDSVCNLPYNITTSCNLSNPGSIAVDYQYSYHVGMSTELKESILRYLSGLGVSKKDIEEYFDVFCSDWATL